MSGLCESRDIAEQNSLDVKPSGNLSFVETANPNFDSGGAAGVPHNRGFAVFPS
jgi:hypothetical protein